MQPPPPRGPCWPRRFLGRLALVALLQGNCPLPPTPAGAKRKDFGTLNYLPTGTLVQYECDQGYKRIPGTSNAIRCVNRRWTLPEGFCIASCLSPPEIHGARLQKEYQGIERFSPGFQVKYDCIPGYQLIPFRDNTLQCSNHSRWTISDPFCEAGCPSPPLLRNAVLQPQFQGKDYFYRGDVVRYDCIAGYAPGPGSNNSIICFKPFRWSKPEIVCKAGCSTPPLLRNATLQPQFQRKNYFSPGEVVRYDCIAGYLPVPGSKNSITCTRAFRWSNPEIICKVVECDDAIIEHGVKLTGFKDKHMYGDSIAFECNIGYFMIGSYLIQCGNNSIWKPEVPSCDKINAKFCGAPLVPSGSVYPLQPQYELGTRVVIECKPQHTFPDGTMEMSTVCQGYNLWKPPAQPCMFRTSPDTSVLTIYHGRIVQGKKELYKPGDNVTIKCHPGYSLKGPPVVRYIGGEKWSPTIPYCSLSFFFILLITALVFFILLVLAKGVNQTYL